MSEVDVTHYSFYVDEDDESILINEEKLKSSGLPYIRRYRTKSCNSSTSSSAAPERHTNGSADNSLFSADGSARGSGSSADDCIDGLNNLKLSSTDHDKENREPSQPKEVVRLFSEKCKQTLSPSERMDACAEPEGEILAQYLEPQQCQAVTRQGNLEQPSKQNTCEVQLSDENCSVVMSAPLAMSTPRPSKVSGLNEPTWQAKANAETAEVNTLPSPSTGIEQNLCSEFGPQHCEQMCTNVLDPVKQRLSFGSSEGTEDAKAGHVFDNQLFCSGIEPLPSSSHIETDQELVAHVPTEILVCDKSFLVSQKPAKEKLQTAASDTLSYRGHNELQSLAVTSTSSSTEHTLMTSDDAPGEQCKQDFPTPVVTNLATQSECLPIVQSGVEMACQTSFCFGNVPTTSTARMTPVKLFTPHKSPQKGTGSAPTKPLLSRRETNLAGSVRGRCRTPSNIPLRSWNSPIVSTKPRETVFKVPTPVSGKTPGKAPVKTPVKTSEKSPVKVEQGQAHHGTPRSVGKVSRPPWSVISPVARYIHENPAPPLIQIVRPRKSPSAKSLTAATSPVHVTTSSASPRLCTGSLPDKRYQTSNMGILQRAGLDPMVKPSKPVVIKHTVSTEADDQSVPEMEASVIQVIRH
ncbi:uncharacterized protein [Dermacentor andersoni]|uniref:uncharacterized protein n=1 Tax=Dermacentor andersoni TaxID=34620 RepID=UPI002155D3DC|nr:uncharacterized protein LOC126541689 [Dermacentor andersoni]